jgi:hypothetical protein
MVQSTLLLLLPLLLSLHGCDSKLQNSSCAATTTVDSAPAPACSRRLLIYESSSFCCPGLGAQLNNMLVAFAVALASDREFVWHSEVSSFGCPPGRGGASPGGLDSRDCLFAPSRCDQAAAAALRARGANFKDCASRDEGGDCAEFVSREATPATRARLFELEDEVLFASQYTTGTAFFQSLWNYHEHYAQQDVCDPSSSCKARKRLCRALGVGTDHPKIGWLQLFQRMAKSVVRLQADAEAAVQELVASVGLRPPFAALHMRFGDKIGTNQYQSTPLTEYLAQEGLRAVTSRDIFVATDDQANVQQQIQRLSEGQRQEHTFHFLAAGGQASTGHVEAKFNEMPSAERYAAHLRVLAEIRILSSSSVFVCNFRSKFALLVEALRDENSSPALLTERYLWFPGG